MERALSIGIAGTAKNTGKTTALNALLQEAHARSVSVGVTSIGYDGESIDNVTGLPKPRIILQTGTLATTSRGCVPPAGWEIVEETGISTALGEALLVRCLDTGPIVLAGPNKRSELASVVERMQALGSRMTMIDGALNRLAPMSVADGLVISTGAARSPDAVVLASETAAIESIFQLSTAPVGRSARIVDIPRSYPAAEEIRGVLALIAMEETVVRFGGLVSASVLRTIAKDRESFGHVRMVVLRDPVVALLSGEPIDVAHALAMCGDVGLPVVVERPLSLSAITVNPFLPRFEGHSYVADSVPAEALHRLMSSAVQAPVVDVLAEGPARLWEAVNRRAVEPTGL